MVSKNLFLRLITNYLIKRKKCIKKDSFFIIRFWPMRGIDDFSFYNFLKSNNVWPQKCNLVILSVFYKNVEASKFVRSHRMCGKI
jgi:hypothetical protein